jgi:pyruvate formate lyase activating enzyme
MKIQGIQKLTLLDYPGKMAATIFTAGCNFRCPFCHNASLVTKIDDRNDIPIDEVFAFLKKRSKMLEGICITGGEPLLQGELEDFIKEVKSMGYLVKLDTNGSDLAKLKRLVEGSLIDYVAMDIKNAPDKYKMTVGLEEDVLPQIIETVDYLKSGVIPCEFRTTLVQEFHKKDDLEVIGSWLKGADKYYLQQFKDSGDLISSGFSPYTDDMMKQSVEIVKKYVPNVALRGVE